MQNLEIILNTTLLYVTYWERGFDTIGGSYQQPLFFKNSTQTEYAGNLFVW